MKLIFLLLFGDFAFEANPSQKSTFISKVNENGTITKKVYGVKTITTVKNVFWQLILEVYVCALNYFKGRSCQLKPKAHIIDDPLSNPYDVSKVLLGPPYGP